MLPFKPQDPRPTSLENLPTEFAPLISPIKNPVARQLLYEPLSFYAACSSSAQLLALPAAATGSAAGHLPLERGSAGEPHASRRRRCTTTTVIGSWSGGFYRVPEHHQRYQQ